MEPHEFFFTIEASYELVVVAASLNDEVLHAGVTQGEYSNRNRVMMYDPAMSPAHPRT